MALLVAAVVWLAADIAAEPASKPPAAAGWIVGALLAALQLARRRWPVAVLAGSAGVVVIYHLAGFAAIGLVWPLLLPYFVAAASGHLLTAALLAVGLTSSSALWRTLVEHEPVLPVAVGEVQGLVVVGLALAVGEATWQRHRWAEEVRDRLARADLDAQREASRQVAEQRLAVAADLHDVAAHSLVVIGLQLRLAEETIRTDPDACEQAIASALAAHDDALRETTTTVRLLRAGDTGQAAPRAPVPGLDEIYGLRGVAAAADLDLTVQVDLGRPLSATTALVAYRIFQEALTNTIRHARARHALLSVDMSDDEVHLRFLDDGTAPPAGDRLRVSAGTGHGLAGMADRARGLGGRLRSGPVPAPGHGFLVEAWLPTPPTAAR